MVVLLRYKWNHWLSFVPWCYPKVKSEEKRKPKKIMSLHALSLSHYPLFFLLNDFLARSFQSWQINLLLDVIEFENWPEVYKFMYYFIQRKMGGIFVPATNSNKCNKYWHHFYYLGRVSLFIHRVIQVFSVKQC